MNEQTIGQRLKILIAELRLDVRGFCKALDVSETTVRNYFNRGSNPNAEFFTKLASAFGLVNLGWLLTGAGEIFLPGSSQTTTNTTNIKNNSSGPVGTVGTSHGPTTINTSNLDACKARLDVLTAENEGLRAQVENLNQLVASKEETLTLMRAVHNRPN